MAFPRPNLTPPTHPLERLPEEWAEVVRGWGEPAYRGKQIFQWIHAKGVLDPNEMSDVPKRLREKLIEEGLRAPLEVAEVHPSDDGTRKLVVRFEDGKRVETVLIPQLVSRADIDDADVEEDETSGVVPGQVVTQCISSQVGCAMGCVFCASGVAGLERHLTTAEIVSQILIGRRHLTGPERVRNVVLMGMGEPLHNYDHVARALVLLMHPDGIGLSSRRVTLSTSGLVPAIDRLGKEFNGQVALALSLHAVTDERRSAIMPVNRKYPLEELVAALRRYPMPKRRRITIEYTLLAGVNDDVGDADKLVRLMRGIPIKVNLIPMNPISGSDLGAPSWRGIEAFQRRLIERGVSTFIRRQRGADVNGACGQLALQDPVRARRKPNRNLPLA